MSEKQFLNYFDGTIKINQKLTIHTNKLKFKELRKMTKKLIHSSYLQYNLTEDEAITCNSRKMKNHCYCPAAQGIRNFVRWQSRKFTKTHEVPHNSAEILLNTCQFNIFETYLGMINLQFILKLCHWNEKTSQYPVFLDYYCEKLGTGQCMIWKSLPLARAHFWAHCC